MAKPKKNKPARSPSQEAADRRNIARLYLKGRLQSEIAEELGVSQPTVSRDIKALIEEWKIERVYDINEAKARELAKIDNLELEYWEAWERSKQNAEVKTKKATRLGRTLTEKEIKDGIQPLDRQEIQERSEGQVGERAFLAGVEWCISMRCKILGVEAPKADGGEDLRAVRLVEVVKTYERVE